MGSKELISTPNIHTKGKIKNVNAVVLIWGIKKTIKLEITEHEAAKKYLQRLNCNL